MKTLFLLRVALFLIISSPDDVEWNPEDERQDDEPSQKQLQPEESRVISIPVQVDGLLHFFQVLQHPKKKLLKLVLST